MVPAGCAFDSAFLLQQPVGDVGQVCDNFGESRTRDRTTDKSRSGAAATSMVPEGRVGTVMVSLVGHSRVPRMRSSVVLPDADRPVPTPPLLLMGTAHQRLLDQPPREGRHAWRTRFLHRFSMVRGHECCT